MRYYDVDVRDAGGVEEVVGRVCVELGGEEGKGGGKVDVVVNSAGVVE